MSTQNDNTPMSVGEWCEFVSSLERGGDIFNSRIETLVNDDNALRAENARLRQQVDPLVAERAARWLMARGVEFDATEQILASWLYRRGYVFGPWGDGTWVWQTSGGDNVDRTRYPSFHELLAELLERVDATDRSGAE
jgi:hypothetical protein